MLTLLSEHFGPAGSVSPWALYIQTADGVASSAQLTGKIGGHYAHFQFGAEDAAILNAISAGDRFLAALARAAAAPAATQPIAGTFAGAAGSLAAALTKQAEEAAAGKPIAAAFPAQAASLAAALTKQTPGTKPAAATLGGVMGSLAAALTKQSPGVKPVAAAFVGTAGGLATALRKQRPGVKPIAADLRRQLPKLRSCEVHDGGWDAAEAQRWPVAAPALLAAWLGTERTEAPGLGWTDCDQRLAVYIVTTDGRERAGGKLLRRGEALRNLVDWLLLYIPRARWTVRGIGPAEDLRARNVYSAAVDKAGAALAEVSWRQTVRLASAGGMGCPALPDELYASPQQDLHEQLHPEAAWRLNH